MKPLEIIRSAQADSLVDEDGNAVTLRLLPGLSAQELSDFAARLPCPLPPDIEELLRYCQGFDGTLEQVDFTGRDLFFECDPLFPYGVPIAHDGYGNFWVVDLTPSSLAWGPIYFACHDAPVILLQGESIERFLTELFKMFRPPFKSEIDDVHEDRIAEVWGKNPGVLEFEACAASQDPVVREFASELDPSWQVVDLRNASIGLGFSWGRYGPDTGIKRFKYLPIFAYQKKPGLFRRLFGK